MATTRSRPRGRESARPSTGGVVAEHATKIYSVAVSAVVVIIAFLALTGTGHVIDAATQDFMLYYAGVFTLIALCTSVVLGLVATDRMILNPGHRIWVQSAHRAASFGALTFLVIHIVTEILAQRVHVLDAFVPFLSPFRTFYIGLGTIASDLILLLVITGILRKRFTANGNAWRWRAIHYASYLAFVFGVWHGLLGGRPGKPYVDWSYGFVVAFVALGLAVRILANSMRPKENLSGPPVPDSAGSGSAPMRAASMFAQLSLARAAASQTALNARSGPQPMLTAPVGDWNERPATGPRAAVAALPAAGPGSDGRPPLYEPGYEGPPRYMGAPRSGTTGPQPRLATGPQPRLATGPQPRAATGPMPRATGSYPTGSHPTASYPAGAYPAGAYRGPRADAAGHDRADAAGGHGADATREHRAHAAGRECRAGWRRQGRHGPAAEASHRADATGRESGDRTGHRADAARRDGPAAAGGERSAPTAGDRSDAAAGNRADAPGGDRSDAARRDRPHAPGRDRLHAPGRDRTKAPATRGRPVGRVGDPSAPSASGTPGTPGVCGAACAPGERPEPGWSPAGRRPPASVAGAARHGGLDRA